MVNIGIGTVSPKLKLIIYLLMGVIVFTALYITAVLLYGYAAKPTYTIEPEDK